MNPLPRNVFISGSEPTTRVLAAALVVFTGLMAGAPAGAAETGGNRFDAAREMIAAGTRDLIDTELNLEPAEADAFWPV